MGFRGLFHHPNLKYEEMSNQIPEALKDLPKLTEGLQYKPEPTPRGWNFTVPDDLYSALRFLKWCDANERSTEAAEEWLLAEVRKLP
jgi:hypothetical protein